MNDTISPAEATLLWTVRKAVIYLSKITYKLIVEKKGNPFPEKLSFIGSKVLAKQRKVKNLIILFSLELK